MALDLHPRRRPVGHYSPCMRRSTDSRNRTCVVAIVWYFLISDFPEDAKWLTESERNYIRARLRADVGRAALERPTNFADVLGFFKDYKVFLGWFMYFGLIVPAYGYAYFSTTIIKTYGYSPIQSKLEV